FQVWLGGLPLFHLQQRPSKLVSMLRVQRVRRQEASVFLFGAVISARLRVKGGQISLYHHVLRLESCRDLIVGNGAFQIAAPAFQIPDEKMAEFVIGIEPDGALIIKDGG